MEVRVFLEKENRFRLVLVRMYHYTARTTYERGSAHSETVRV